MRNFLLDVAKRSAGLISVVQPLVDDRELGPSRLSLERDAVGTEKALPRPLGPPAGLAAPAVVPTPPPAPVARLLEAPASFRQPRIVTTAMAPVRPTSQPAEAPSASSRPPELSTPDLTESARRDAEPPLRLPGPIPAAVVAPQPVAHVAEAAPVAIPSSTSPVPVNLEVHLTGGPEAVEPLVVHQPAAPVVPLRTRNLRSSLAAPRVSSPVAPAPQAPTIPAARRPADSGEPHIEVRIGRIEIEPPRQPEARRRAPRGFSGLASARAYRDRRWY
jgi:hypothetical protein